MSAPDRREWLAVLAKAPIAGEVKTRLQAELGPEGAASLYACFLRDTIETMERVAKGRSSVRLALCGAGFRSGRDVFESFDLRRFWTLAQLGSTLGARLEVCFDMLFDENGGRADAVVAIGADTPHLPAELVSHAFVALEEGGPERLVLGPAVDGGYYLVGMNRRNPTIFDGVAWSTSTVLADTLRAARTARLDVHLLPEWYDVDTADELRRLRAELLADPSAAPHSARHFGAT